MARCEIGICLWPWYPVRTLLEYAEQALQVYPFDQLWLADEFQYEDPFTVLTAAALRLDVSVGTMVTFPHRNPLELAQRFSSIAGLISEGREVGAGIGAGGAVQEQVIKDKAATVAVMDETVRLLRGLFAGEAVPLADFPALERRFRYNPRSRAKLYFPPPGRVPVYVAAGGPRMFELAGRLGDGVILSQSNSWTSVGGVREGLFKQAVQMVQDGWQRSGRTGTIKKLYNLHVSVHTDGKRARQWAKRNAAYTLAGCFGRDPQTLAASGVTRVDELQAIREAFTHGLGVEEGARRVSDRLFEESGFVLAGNPAEVVAQCEWLLPRLRDYGMDHLVVGVPLGPDVPLALQLIARDVVPALRGMLD
jgi:alkanesulfonate monooxygenase SsuD/methylene tetrahydromethanopterin reductase-like flavin-dependent oxidoreductase (luciferase family)